VTRGQKWSVILEILWLACYNSEIDWRIREVKITRCLEECRKQWRPKQGKSGKNRRKKKRRRKRERKKEGKRKTKKKKNNRSKKDSRRIGNLR